MSAFQTLLARMRVLDEELQEERKGRAADWKKARERREKFQFRVGQEAINLSRQLDEAILAKNQGVGAYRMIAVTAVLEAFEARDKDIDRGMGLLHPSLWSALEGLRETFRQ